MQPTLNKMLSTLGYEALNQIFDIKQESLSEVEKRKLVELAMKQESEEQMRERVLRILNKEVDKQEKVKLLLDLDTDKNESS
ncbi:hypothetical protein MUO14_15995 [Halobacillus shinanisalinarum]|uniref:Uncharacterized protein n=1 Tax=Halobacillus shinanisalinarum TaxID=2932258 RepID=A0ABY4GVJ8_9BACI|nr:hypothetical protein [Halobacillus shinanisalinarum]UOQ91994.1 hypothetical protein MUO14_15995 [Halobacillus shinanisalinarum]